MCVCVLACVHGRVNSHESLLECVRMGSVQVCVSVCMCVCRCACAREVSRLSQQQQQCVCHNASHDPSTEGALLTFIACGSPTPMRRASGEGTAVELLWSRVDVDEDDVMM